MIRTSKHEDRKNGAFIAIRNPLKPEEILWVKHSYGDRKWSLPGGGLCIGEMPTVAAYWEVREETTIEIKKLKLIGTFPTRLKYGQVHFFEALEWEGTPYPGNGKEIEKCEFARFEDIKDGYTAQISLAMIFRLAENFNGHLLSGYLTVPPIIVPFSSDLTEALKIRV